MLHHSSFGAPFVRSDADKCLTAAMLKLCLPFVQEMKAFWVPSQGKEARHILDKPDQNTYCPASGKKLRLKDLIPVRFTRVPEEDSGVYMDPVTKDTFTNASSMVVLRPTGDHTHQALCLRSEPPNRPTSESCRALCKRP